ncbi:MAG: hypothetical protein ACOCUU_03490 [Nanoarchaeota archaeon]
MFEKRLKELSRKIGEKEKSKFYILTHKKHKREVYFQNKQRAINFLKYKLTDSTSKKFKTIKSILYLFIKLRFAQLFLKKIKLSSRFGEVIFVGGKINSFDLGKKEVLSFPLRKSEEKELIRSKRFQSRVAKKGFAPEVLEMNKNVPYSREKMFEVFQEGSRYKIFKKLMKFYGFMGIEKISIKEYVERLRRELKKQGIKNDFIYNKLDSLSKEKIKLLSTTLHGDFAKENTLVKDDGEIVFIDWHPYEGLITNGIINYFRSTEDTQSSFYFKKIIKAFPKEVQKNIRIYLILSEIDLIVKKNRKPSWAIKKIKNIRKPSRKNPNQRQL